MCCWALFIWWANTQRTHITAKWNMHIENMNSSTARARSNPALTPFAHFRPGVYLNFSIFTNRKAIQLVGRWELRCATNYWPLCRAHRVCSSSQPTRERERYGAYADYFTNERAIVAHQTTGPSPAAFVRHTCLAGSRHNAHFDSIIARAWPRIAVFDGSIASARFQRVCRQYNALRLYRSLARCDRYF